MSLVCGGASCTTVKLSSVRSEASQVCMIGREIAWGAIPVIPDDGPRFKYIRAEDSRWAESLCVWGGGLEEDCDPIRTIAQGGP